MEHYDNVLKYAQAIGDTTLQGCLEKLRKWETNPNSPCEIELYKDFAPHSFLFKQRFSDGSYGIIGGLVYHGSPDESMCVTFDTTKGWQTHT